MVVGRLLAVLVLVALAVGVVVWLPDDEAPTAFADSDCESAPATTLIDPSRDAVVGPLVLLTAQLTPGHQPDAFNRHGYKLPVTLPAGTDATLRVPRAFRRRVGLVYSLDAQRRASEQGVRGATTSFRFRACDIGPHTRVGWGGGLVVDRPRCVNLILKSEGARQVRRRVPLGRAC